MCDHFTCCDILCEGTFRTVEQRGVSELSAVHFCYLAVNAPMTKRLANYLGSKRLLLESLNIIRYSPWSFRQLILLSTWSAMAPDLQLHTSLENLLLFQTLQQSEEKPPSFGKISEVLKTNHLLRESDSYVEDRLEPGSLERNYLHLLKEEVKSGGQRDHDVQNGDENSQKLKRSSPLLETAEEALEYAHLLPQLTNRLYFRYRDEAIKYIHDEDRTHRALQAEIQDIERRERDARLQLDNASRRDPRGVSSIQQLLRHDDENERVCAGNQPRATTSRDQQNGVDVGAHTGTSQSLPTRSVYDSPVAQSGHPIGAQKQLRPTGPAEPNVPLLPPLQHGGRGFSVGSPSSDTRRLPPPHQVLPHPPPSPSSRSAHKPLLPERSSASPIILPPPPGMLGSSGSPTGPLDALADMAGQQYRASPSMPSPRSVQHPHQSTQGRFYIPRPYSHNEKQPPYQAPYSPYGQGPSPQASYQYQGAMPPYQGSATTPAHGSPYGNVPSYQASMSPYSQHPGYSQTPGYYQQPPAQSPYPRGPVPRFQDQYTPMSNTLVRQRPSMPTPITTSASSTRWKNIDVATSIRQPSPRSPSPGAVSPISGKTPSPLVESPQLRTSSSRSQHIQNPPTHPPSGAIRSKAPRGRGISRRYRGGRTASAESSALAGSTQARTRSQSVVSQIDELSIDQPATRRIKAEPSGTSAHEDDESIASPMADENGRKPNRQRRGTFIRHGTADSNHTNSKRKREESTILQPLSSAPTQISRPGFVLGTRNLHRTSTNLMNDILAHKVGNMFSKPLTEREAPGYRDLVFRPQDIKSIKAAITAGSKALQKAAENMGEKGNSSNVWVPETPDVIPPRGIVNSAQLEKELMRMFANAIMFNPDVPSQRSFGPAFRTRQRTVKRGAVYSDDEDQGEDEVIKGKQDVSVVKDTREMFEAVEKKVAEWRSAERATEEGGASKAAIGRLRGGGSEEVDELAGDGDGENVIGTVEQESTPEPKSKRRKR